MARTLIVSDRHNSFFSANNIRVGNQIPTEGNYVKGDIIVNIGESTATEAMWICIESGNPGVWEVVGAGAGAGVNTKLTSITNHVILESGVSEVEIGIGGFNAGDDTMLVFKNGVNMAEGVDYEVQGGKIVSTGEVWNENGIEDYGMTFVIFKKVVEYDGDVEIKAENIADGSIGMDKLADDVKEAIEEASNIDLSGYASKEEVNSKVAQDEYDAKIEELEERVNEAFTSANNGKQLIANAIGEPLDSNDTFSAMSNDINGLLSQFKTNMMNNGIAVESGDKFKALIDKMKGLTTLRDSLADILENKGVDVTEEDDIASLISKVDGLNLGGVDIISSASLPASVKDRQLVVVTDTPMTEAVFHNLQPTIGSGIQEGGVWINTTNNNNVFEYIVSDSPKFSFYILDCYQVISGSYVKKQIYCGVNGEWQHVNPNLYFIQEFINDNPLTKIDGYFTNTYNEGVGCQRLHYNTNGGNHSVAGTHKTVKQFNTTGFSKLGLRFSVTHVSTAYIYFYSVATNSQVGFVYGGSSTSIKTLELDISKINDLCYIHVDIQSTNNVNGNYMADIYDLYLTN